MTALTRGQNVPLPAARLTVTVACAVPVDVSALLLAANGKVRSDADMIFFNQPVGPGVQFSGNAGNGTALVLDVDAVPADVEKVVVTASLDGSGPPTFAAAGPIRVLVGDEVTFDVTELGQETAAVCVELYRRNGQWKVRAVGQGYESGLAGIAGDFGVDVDEPTDDPGPADPTPPTAPVRPSSTPAAPPPQPTAQTGTAMQSDLFAQQHAEVDGRGIQKQGSKMCKIGLDGEVMVRSGSMVAYQGDMQFKALGSGGMRRAIMQRVTGEGVPLMKVSGRGDLFVADAAADVHLIDLDGSDGLTVNGSNVLAFDASLSYDVRRVQGAAMASNAGLFNCVFSGVGRIAITTEGGPVVLNVDQPTYADPQAAVAWSSSLSTSVKQNDQLGLGTLIGRSTGERFTLQFSGRGFVVVQPSELPPGGLLGGTGSGQQAGPGSSGGGLGGLLGNL